MAPPTLERSPMTTLTPSCLPPTPQSPLLLFSSPFYVKLSVTPPYQEEISHTTASFNTPTCITKKNRETQCVHSDRERHTRASETSHSQRYLFPIKLSGRARKLETILIYDSLEALGTNQAHQVSYCETILN